MFNNFTEEARKVLLQAKEEMNIYYLVYLKVTMK